MSRNYWQYRRTDASRAFRAARDLLQSHRLDHERAYAEFRWPRSAFFNWALEWFDIIAADNSSPALELIDDDERVRSVSFGELSARSDAVACWLRNLGLAAGDRVLVVLGACQELWESMLACLKLGATIIPMYTTVTAVEAADRVRRGGIRAVVCDSGLTALFEGCGEGCLRIAVPGSICDWIDYAENADQKQLFFPDGATPADAIAFAYFTSGTTASPKLVAHTNASYPVGHLSSMYWNGLLPGDRHLNISVPGWAKHSWSSFFVPWNAEATIVAVPDGLTRPERLPALLLAQRVDSFCAPPSAWRAMLPYLELARPALREATSAGEPLDSHVAEQVKRSWRVNVRDGYGQTETTALIGTPPGLQPRPGWLGKPMPGYRLTLYDPETGVCGDAGEICVDLEPAPVGVMHGYLDGSARTAHALGGKRYSTGDIGERGPDGWIRVWGRRDDVFKSFDHRISPYEVEAALRGHPEVAEVAVIARPHPTGGAVPVAVIVPRQGCVPNDQLAGQILAYAAGQLAPALRPRAVEFALALPRTLSGKIRRDALAGEHGAAWTIPLSDNRTDSSGGASR